MAKVKYRVLQQPNMFVYGGGDDVAQWCQQHGVLHVKEYMNRMTRKDGKHDGQETISE